MQNQYYIGRYVELDSSHLVRLNSALGFGDSYLSQCFVLMQYILVVEFVKCADVVSFD